MKGILLAGGSGSRLYPLTKGINKQLLPVGKFPMALRQILLFRSAGITDIMVITGKDHAGDIINLLGSGEEYGVNITYKVQNNPAGIAHGLGLAKNFVGKDNVCLLLGDNFFHPAEFKTIITNVNNRINSSTKLLKTAIVVLQRIPIKQMTKVGIPVFDEDNRIIEVVEKPTKSVIKTDGLKPYCVTGLYFYPSNVFNYIKTLTPSARGELEISDVNSKYAYNYNLEHIFISQGWHDAGTIQSYSDVNQLLRTRPDWEIDE